LLESGSAKSLFRKMLPRVIKAIVKGVLWSIFLYVLLTFLISSLSEFAPSIFESYVPVINVFIFLMVFFVVVGELTSGTIFQHAFNIGRALISMIFIVYALSGGIVALDVESVHVVADLRIFLLILLAIDFIGLAKSVLQAINFLSEKAEKQLPALSPS